MLLFQSTLLLSRHDQAVRRFAELSKLLSARGGKADIANISRSSELPRAASKGGAKRIAGSQSELWTRERDNFAYLAANYTEDKPWVAPAKTATDISCVPYRTFIVFHCFAFIVSGLRIGYLSLIFLSSLYPAPYFVRIRTLLTMNLYRLVIYLMSS